MNRILVVSLLFVCLLAGCVNKGVNENDGMDGIRNEIQNSPEGGSDLSPAPDSKDPSVLAKISDIPNTGTDPSVLYHGAQLCGVVTDLEEQGFTVEPAFLSIADDGEVFEEVSLLDQGDVCIDENTLFKLASITADVAYSVHNGQKSDLVDGANVLVSGTLQEDNTWLAVQIIVYDIVH